MQSDVFLGSVFTSPSQGLMTVRLGAVNKARLMKVCFFVLWKGNKSGPQVLAFSAIRH